MSGASTPAAVPKIDLRARKHAIEIIFWQDRTFEERADNNIFTMFQPEAWVAEVRSKHLNALDISIQATRYNWSLKLQNGEMIVKENLGVHSVFFVKEQIENLGVLSVQTQPAEQDGIEDFVVDLRVMNGGSFEHASYFMPRKVPHVAGHQRSLFASIHSQLGGFIGGVPIVTLFGCMRIVVKDHKSYARKADQMEDQTVKFDEDILRSLLGSK